jgi:hypothetical protein
MADDTYHAPGIEDRTPVSEPLNTLPSSERPPPPTPAWRSASEPDE